MKLYCEKYTARAKRAFCERMRICEIMIIYSTMKSQFSQYTRMYICTRMCEYEQNNPHITANICVYNILYIYIRIPHAQYIVYIVPIHSIQFPDLVRVLTKRVYANRRYFASYIFILLLFVFLSQYWFINKWKTHKYISIFPVYTYIIYLRIYARKQCFVLVV